MAEKEFANCPHCNYSAPPDRVYTERKHFDAHSLRCSRCLYQTETKASWLEASLFWNKASAARSRADVGGAR
jgi:hypothetical protein